jgi:1,4-dihydroxy-6-naphthoate synthase
MFIMHRSSEETPLSLAHSPCPNDLYIFSAWEQGLSTPRLPRASVRITDIQSLNQLALSGSVDIAKVSAGILGELHRDYVLLPVGAALGYGVGPKLVARQHLSLAEAAKGAILSPGVHTMAHRLLKELVQPRDLVPMKFSEIIPALVAGHYEVGAVINESRFALAEHGLVEIADLGQLWWRTTQLPLPLGALVAKRSLGEEKLAQICTVISASLHFARDNEATILPFIKARSVEKSEEALRRHIELYVNQDTFDLSPAGHAAFKALAISPEAVVRQKAAPNYLDPLRPLHSPS